MLYIVQLLTALTPLPRYSNALIELAQEVMLLACIWGISGSNIGLDIDYLD
jgi:hypothetical protein